ncbi:MAG TPA: ammonium transporter [Verrucomicrobiae bacterium]|nr:ammonium transporter [Verrucomicrobiae bacterium]
MYIPSPSYLSPGDNAWQLTAGTLVGLMSIPGLAVLYGGVVKRKWAVSSAVMVFYAFAAVLVVWVLAGFNMGFGHSWIGTVVGLPRPVLSSASETAQAAIPLLKGLMPAIRFPGSSLIYFQFVFAAITPIILAGALFGRINFKAWMLFVPLWSVLVYSINAFLLWGGGWLSGLGVVDYSGGYVIHVAAGISGFVGAAVIGPRTLKDQQDFKPNNMLLAMVGAGILWLGWNGFNGGDPYFANADAAAAVLNTNLATAVALLTWFFFDMMFNKKLSMVGAINGMVCGLVAITPAAGYVDGYGAIIVGLLGSAIPWLTMNKLAGRWPFRKVDDTLGVIHTHYMAGAVGGILVGLIANPAMIVYVGVRNAGASVAGVFAGNPHQLLVQAFGLVFITAYDGAMTFVILKLIGVVVPLRMTQRELEHGDRVLFNEEVFELHHPIPVPEPIDGTAPAPGSGRPAAQPT